MLAFLVRQAHPKPWTWKLEIRQTPLEARPEAGLSRGRHRGWEEIMSLSEIAVPTFVRLLGSLSGFLDKAAAHAEAKKIDAAVLLGTRLIPDMFPLARQVQLASDFAKARRLGSRDRNRQNMPMRRNPSKSSRRGSPKRSNSSSRSTNR
jgi:hypothetical protein